MDNNYQTVQTKKSKKPLLAGFLLILVGLVGGTLAYFTSSDTFTNEFKTKPYKMEVTEVFESPDNWTPGTVTSKTVIATNKGDVPAAVRVSYTESWVDANNQTLPLKDGSNNVAAIIHFADDLNTKWTQSTEGGVKYYYYKTKIGKNVSTSSLINSVEFNPAVVITDNSADPNRCVTDETTHTTTCTTTTSGYAGGTYKLEITVETVQYDQYAEAWNTSVVIS